MRRRIRDKRGLYANLLTVAAEEKRGIVVRELDERDGVAVVLSLPNSNLEHVIEGARVHKLRAPQLVVQADERSPSTQALVDLAQTIVAGSLPLLAATS